MRRKRLSRLGIVCAECGRLTIAEPANFVLCNEGWILDGDEKTVRDIYSALLEECLGTGETTWVAAARVLQLWAEKTGKAGESSPRASQ
jgi:hypothetical protein